MREISFDDMEQLGGLVSEEFGPWGEPVEVTQSMIGQFADLTGDHQWIHTDIERAKKESPFGGPIAHGFLTVSLLPVLNSPSSVKIVGYGNAANYGSDGFRFLAPVPAGSKLHSHTRVVSVQQKKKGTLVTSETAVHVVGNDTPSLIYKGLVLYQPKRG